jgi:predicted nuclease of predicted toxin-antitoxin system
VDAQLPRRMAYRFREAGHDAVHTLDLPAGNRTSDAEVLNVAEREQRIVVTKDADFVNSFVVARKPERLLLVSTGNITNPDLEALLLPNIAGIAAAFASGSSFVELTQTALIVHT